MEKIQEAVLLTRAQWDQAYFLANVLARMAAQDREVLCAVALDLAQAAEQRR